MVYYPAPNVIAQPVRHRPVDQQPVSNYIYPTHNYPIHNNPQPLRQAPVQQPVIHFNQSPPYVSNSIPHQNYQLYHLD
jgi:hypothetical protein